MNGVGVVTAIGSLPDVERLVTANVWRLAVSAAIVGVVLGVRYLTGRVKRRNGELTSKQRLLLSTTVAGTTAAGVLGLLVVWERSGAIVDAYEAALIADHLSNIVLAVVLLASAYAVTDFLGGVIRELAVESTAISEHQEEMLLRIVQLSVYTLVALVTIGLFTDNVGSLLVGAGFLGIVVGMAARQTLGAVLAGFVLMFSRPFEVGDWVEIGDHEGTVTEISIINTRLRSFDGEVVTVPNDRVRSETVVDRSRRNRLRIGIEVGVDYDTDVERAAAVIESTVSDVDGIARMPEPDVVTKRFADSAVVLGVRYWITKPSMRKQWRTRTAAMNAIKADLEAAGITIPFPQQTLSARKEEFGVQLDSRVGRDPDSGTSNAGGSGGTGASNASGTSDAEGSK
ncbi:small-conductance mechanosensitive channel [Halorubrum alkaliphilum]|uniref:Small-conductance mechanosensitive channel n=1 Tax=Halorubrum alkaliphilum TaxID=261290 RepID=A0A8T4GH57_9EURY|nr:mechanosensitive ion channel family protein [Halorubrum alkaliphilum]MBP1922990.1 small-conductance mechanosensitive channel [Halorubrum alkaliphilum]